MSKCTNCECRKTTRRFWGYNAKGDKVSTDIEFCPTCEPEPDNPYIRDDIEYAYNSG